MRWTVKLKLVRDNQSIVRLGTAHNLNLLSHSVIEPPAFLCRSRHSRPRGIDLLSILQRHARRLPAPRLRNRREINVQRRKILRRPTRVECPLTLSTILLPPCESP